MNDTDYPALYRAADAAAKACQRAHLSSVAGLAATAILGAGLSLHGITSQLAAIAASVVFLIGLGIAILMAFKNFEAAWYRARAVAESVKTVCWRFVMRAEPFDATDEKLAAAELIGRLRKILAEHRDLAHALAGITESDDQITPTMLAVRELPLRERVKAYTEHRIDDQRKWYKAKASYNKRKGLSWFLIMVGLQGGAVLSALVRIARPSWAFLPTEVFAVAATSALGWIHVKKFRELAAAYAVTAHEIGFAREQISRTNGEAEFSLMVSETENAFSREHTQWIARRDV